LSGSFVVGEDGGDRIGSEAVAAAQMAELHEESDTGDDTAGVLDEPAHGAGGATGGEEIVDDEHAGTGRYGIGVDLQNFGAVL
jgi:hypothetical protein